MNATAFVFIKFESQIIFYCLYNNFNSTYCYLTSSQGRNMIDFRDNLLKNEVNDFLQHILAIVT